MGEKGVYHNYLGAKVKFLNKNLVLGGKVDYVTRANTHNKVHGKLYLGPEKSLGPGLPNRLDGGILSSKLSSDRSITIDGGLKFIFGVKIGAKFGLQ